MIVVSAKLHRGWFESFLAIPAKNMFSHGITLLIMVEVFEQSKSKNNVISTLLLTAVTVYCHLKFSVSTVLSRLPVKLTKREPKHTFDTTCLLFGIISLLYSDYYRHHNSCCCPLSSQ